MSRSAPCPADAIKLADGCTNLKLRQLTRRVTSLYDRELARTGLKTTQFSLLSHVVELGPLRPGELARHLQMDASTLTRNLQPLIAAGWIELGAGRDARSRQVNLTEAGRLKQQEAVDAWRQAQHMLNTLLSGERIAALHGLIDDALARLAASGDEAAP